MVLPPEVGAGLSALGSWQLVVQQVGSLVVARDPADLSDGGGCWRLLARGNPLADLHFGKESHVNTKNHVSIVPAERLQF